MSDLFLPRELFQDSASGPRPATTATAAKPATPAAAPRRGAVQFTSGAEVAADLMQAMNTEPEPRFVERRRKPRTGKPFNVTR
ncbi:MAG: hypothetical protein KF892_12865 [Rhizobacter sp.]|nr:hypothetical protein [Rhizobacter sp.]